MQSNSAEEVKIIPQKTAENSIIPILNNKSNLEVINEHKPTNINDENLKAKNNSIETFKNQKDNITEIAENKNVSKIIVLILDTFKITKPKKVIVVKKIIKRDTVYIKK